MNVYDFDNTIYKGDSTADFYIFCLKRHKKIIFLLPSLIAGAVKLYVFKRGTKTQFKEKMFRFLKYAVYPGDLEDFWQSRMKNIKEWYLRQKEDTDVIISASPCFLLEPVCRKLKIKNLLASPVDKNTGKYSGENCHGEEKARRFYDAFPKGEIDKFYSDSKGDAPLAKIAKEAFIVHGDDIKPWKF